MSNFEWLDIAIIGATAFLHTSNFLGSSNFELCFYFSDIQANSAKLAKAPNLSNVPSKYHKFTDIFNVMGRLNTNNFYFLFFYFSDFILILFYFYFSFGQWRGTWHWSHMTGHMMWCHRSRTWWKDLEDNVRAYVYNIVALRWTWGCSMDNRAGLIIGSMDQACFV